MSEDRAKAFEATILNHLSWGDLTEERLGELRGQSVDPDINAGMELAAESLSQRKQQEDE